MDNNFIETAKNRLKNHNYSLLASGERTEVWSCKNPKSICYGFIISITPMGISVVGDIGNYTFTVARGIEFLAGRDIEYYILSKLDSIYRGNAFDKEYFLETIMDNLRSLFEDNEEYYKYINSDYLLTNINNKNRLIEDFTRNELKNIKESDFKDDLVTALKEAMQIEDIQSAYLFLRDNEFLKMWDCDYNYNKTEHSTIQALYMINEAAKNINKLFKKERIIK